jgi:F-type H+-transporting ATPase subunit delta
MRLCVAQTPERVFGLARVFGLSGRYATALFELAIETPDTLERVLADVASLEQALSDSQDFKALIQSPVLARATAQRTLQALTDLLALSPLTQRFLAVLASNRRLASLPAILADFKILYDAHKGIVNVQAQTAQPLTPAQQSALLNKLVGHLRAQVKLTTHVNPALLGGLVVQIGSKLIDNSLKTKLDIVSLAMKG